MQRLIKYMRDSRYRFFMNDYLLLNRPYMEDELYLKKKFRVAMNKELDLDCPYTFNEKLQWLKLYDRQSVYTTMVDKNLIKQYVAKQIGEQYIIPTIGIWDNPDNIDFEELPNQFVLKCNHNSGQGMYICHDKSKMNIRAVKQDLKKGLKQDYYLMGREWPYKNVPRKIIAEQYMEDNSGGLIDYKVHCFNGEPKFILVCADRFNLNGLTEDFVTPEWERMPVKRPDIRNSDVLMDKPKEIEEILELAKKLSENIPFVRVDFYIINHKVYFSEMTFFPASGFKPFEPQEWDNTFGDWLKLPNK